MTRAAQRPAAVAFAQAVTSQAAAVFAPSAATVGQAAASGGPEPAAWRFVGSQARRAGLRMSIGPAQLRLAFRRLRGSPSTVLQQLTSPLLPTWRGGQSIVRQEGWVGLWRGNTLNAMKASPQKALDWSTFELYKALLHPHWGAGPAGTFTAAGLAGATSCLLLHPLEVVRSRVTAGRGLTPLVALRGLVQQEGVQGLYRGLGPSLAAIIPEAALVYGLFDVMKTHHLRRHGREAGAGRRLMYGVLSAVAGQTVSFPVEAIARRMQVAASRVTIRQVMREAAQQPNGLASLYSGILPAWLRMLPMALVSFGSYELMQQRLAERTKSTSLQGGTSVQNSRQP